MTASDIDRLVAIRDNEEEELTDWEESFIRSCINQLERKGLETGLSPKQMAIVEKIENVIQSGRPNTR